MASNRPGAGPLVGGGLLLLYILLPVLAVFLFLDWPTVARGLGSSVLHQALRVSLGTSTAALAVIIILGTPLAHALARNQLPAGSLLDTLVDLPMVLPPAVAGVALLMAFGRMGLLGRYLYALGVSIPFSATAVVMAQVFIAAPFYVRAARAGFAAVDPSLEAVALTLGNSPAQAFRRITLPLALPSLLGGAVMAWARALGEFGATILFAGNLPGRTQTMPLAIYSAMESDLQAALFMAALMVLVSFLVLATVRRLAGRPQAPPSGGSVE